MLLMKLILPKTEKLQKLILIMNLDNIMELRKLLKEKEDENYFLKMELKKYNH